MLRVHWKVWEGKDRVRRHVHLPGFGSWMEHTRWGHDTQGAGGGIAEGRGARFRRVCPELLPSVPSPGVTMCSRPSPPLFEAQWIPKGPGERLGFVTRSLVDVSLRGLFLPEALEIRDDEPSI